MGTLKLELIKLCHHEGREAQQVVDRAKAYEAFILSGDDDKPAPATAPARPTLTAAKPANAEAGAKR